MEWIKTTLQTYPEIAIFLSLAVGYFVGGKSFKGFSLGAVTATLLAAIVIGQLDISVSATVKNVFFLMFLFAIGYGIGPQFVRGIAKDGLPQAGFAAIVCLFCLAFPIIAAKVAGYDLGSAAGLFAGSQTISASMGLATDAINRLGLPAEQTTNMLSEMPVAYAVSYIFGTIGSAILLAQVFPKMFRIDLEKACKDYEEQFGAGKSEDGEGVSWHQYVLRAYAVKANNPILGLTLSEFENKFPGRKVFVEALKRDDKIVDVNSSLRIEAGDVLVIGGDHGAVVKFFSDDNLYEEIEDDQLTNQEVTGLDVYVSKKAVDGKTLEELAKFADAHGVFLRRIKRGLAGVEMPILAKTKLHKGDVVTLFGLDKDVKRAAKDLGIIDQKSTVSDVAFLSGVIVIGTLVGAIVIKVFGVPLTLSTAGGALIAGLVFGWLRSIHPTFGYIPDSTVWFMNSVGLNVFIAVVGLTAGPNFVAGLENLGLSLFLWGVFATTLPLFCAVLVGKYLFKFHPAILFGCCAGARTTTAALGMINETARSNIPSLGYTITYAVGNTLLTIWGMVIIMILS